MLKLSVTDLIQGDETCYSFVIAIAKRARAISEKANDEHELLDEKPVQMAVKEYTQGKFRILHGGEPVTEADADAFEQAAREAAENDEKPTDFNETAGAENGTAPKA